MRPSTAILSVVLSALATPAATAAETDLTFGYEPDAFEIKAFVQPRFTLDLTDDAEPSSSFRVRRGRIYLTGTVSPRIQGRVLIEARPEGVEALDVYFDVIPFRDTPGLTVRLGQFKRPFSRQEFRHSSSNLNLIDRPMTNSFLESGLRVSSWDLGAMGTLNLNEGQVPVRLDLAFMNGMGKGVREDQNSGKQIVARGAFQPTEELALGGNASIHRLGMGDGAETHFVWGLDGEWERELADGSLQILSEVFGGDNYASVFGAATQPEDVPSFIGWYGEAIFRLNSGFQPGARLELFDGDTDEDDSGLLGLTLQGAYEFSRNFRWQINFVHTNFNATGVDSENKLVSQWTVRM